MPLIAQVYCPLETSSLERVVYTFSCPRKSCRGKPGSTRAWRANVVWAEAIEQQQKKDRRKEEQAQARQEAERGGSSGGAGGAGKTQLDLGSLIFGGLPDRSSAIAATSSSTSAAAPTPFSSSSVSSSSPLATSTTTAASTAYANTNTNTKFNPFAFTSSSATSASVSTGASINPFAPAASSDAATATPNPFAPVRVAPTSSTTPPPPQLESQVANPVSSVPMTWPLPPTTNDDSVIGFEFEYRPEYLTTAYEPTGGTTMKVAASTSMESKLESDLTQQMGSLEVRNSSALAPGSGNASTRGPGTDGRKKNKDADFGLGGGDDDGEDQGEGDEYPRRREGKGSGGRRKKGAPSHASDKRVGGAGAGRSLTTTGGGEPGGWSGESYEVQRVAGVDDVFLAFQARVDREPTQLLRSVQLWLASLAFGPSDTCFVRISLLKLNPVSYHLVLLFFSPCVVVCSIVFSVSGTITAVRHSLSHPLHPPLDCCFHHHRRRRPDPPARTIARNVLDAQHAVDRLRSNLNSCLTSSPCSTEIVKPVDKYRDEHPQGQKEMKIGMEMDLIGQRCGC